MVGEPERSWPLEGFDARCGLMLEITLQTLRCDADLRLCEGLRLIDATRGAVSRLAPASLPLFDRVVSPGLRRVLLERFGVDEQPPRVVN